MSRVARFLALVFVFLPFAAWAQFCNLQDVAAIVRALDGDYDQALATIKDRKCLGSKERDADPLVQQVDKALEARAGKNLLAERHSTAIAILNDLAAHARQRTTAPGTIRREEWLAIGRGLEQSARELDLAAKLPVPDLIRASERALPREWERISEQTQGELVFDGKPVRLLATGCKPNTPMSACPAFQDQIGMIRVVNLAARLRDVTQRESLTDHLADARLQLERWEAYRSKAHHQYFWEVWLNGQLMGEDLCPVAADTGIQRGFCSVPTSQWIVAHPDAGLRYSRHANASNELRPAFLIEVVGYYRWGWKAKDSADMTDRLGASLVAAYTDEPGRNWSFGPMVYFGDGYNLAATRASGGKWSLVLNVKLADRYFERKQKYTDYLKSLRKPDWKALLRD